MDPTNHNILFAAVGDIFGGLAINADAGGALANGVYETLNGGASWTRLSSFPGGVGTGRISLGIADVGPSITLYASIADPFSGATMAIEKSTNGGSSWNPIMTESSANYLNYMGDQGWYDQTLIIDPKDPTGNTVYAAGQADLNNYPDGGIIKTTNGGTTWTDITLNSDGSQPHVDHHAIGFDASGRLLDGNDGGIWRLDNPNPGKIQWTDLNGNLQITQFTGIALDPTDPNIAFGGSQDNGTEQYTGSPNWNMVFGGDGGFVRVDPNNPQRVYTENFGISLARSDNGGITFNDISTGIQGKADNDISPLQPNFYLPYVLDPQNTNRVVLATDYVNQSLNNGNTWTAIGVPGVNGFNPSDDGVTAVATLGNTVYAATTDGNVWVTTKNGTSWTQSDPIPVNSSPFYFPPFYGYQDIQIDTSDTTGRTAYIVTANFSQDIDGTTSGHDHVFKTTNAGATWTDISGNLPNLPVWSIAIDHADNTLFVGTDNGVYASTNGGTSWSPFGTGMPNAQVVSLEYSPTLHLLAAGTHGRGMFEIGTEQSLTVVPPPNQTTSEGGPSRFSLGFFSDPNPTATSWTVDINWGDGSPDAVFTTNKQGALGSTSHPYAEEGKYTLTIQVTNNNGMSDSMTSSVTIVDFPVDISFLAFPAVEGKALINQAVATFTDLGGAELSGGISSHYTATIVWGDFTPPTAGTITFSNGVFTVSGSHTYAEEGSYPVSVLIDHEGVFTNSGTQLQSVVSNAAFQDGDFTDWTTSSTFGPGGQFFSKPEVVGAGVTPASASSPPHRSSATSSPSRGSTATARERRPLPRTSTSPTTEQPPSNSTTARRGTCRTSLARPSHGPSWWISNRSEGERPCGAFPC